MYLYKLVNEQAPDKKWNEKTCGDAGEGELRFSFIGDILWPSPPSNRQTHHMICGQVPFTLTRFIVKVARLVLWFRLRSHSSGSRIR